MEENLELNNEVNKNSYNTNKSYSGETNEIKSEKINNQEKEINISEKTANSTKILLLKLALIMKIIHPLKLFLNPKKNSLLRKSHFKNLLIFT